MNFKADLEGKKDRSTFFRRENSIRIVPIFRVGIVQKWNIRLLNQILNNERVIKSHLEIKYMKSCKRKNISKH